MKVKKEREGTVREESKVVEDPGRDPLGSSTVDLQGR